MDTISLTQNPSAVLTFIVAPAILTNATGVLAMGTINPMLRARERMHELAVGYFEKWHGRPAHERAGRPCHAAQLTRA